MRELTMAELKKLQLDMLLDFDEYCQENNLTYFISGGTLLGAVRHKGFIPWDDDIDISMPRKDYEKFIHEYKEGEKYKVVSVELNDKAPMHANLVNKTTKLTNVKGGSLGYAQYVFLDIFPVDILPNNKLIRYVICYIKELLIYCYHGSILDFSTSKRYNDRDGGIFNWKKGIRSFLKYIFVAIFHCTNARWWGKLINNFAMLWQNKKTGWQGCLVTAAHNNNGLSEMLPKEVFSKTIKLEFEGYWIDAMVGYREYLSSLYGDYMKLPPKDKQVSHHDYIAYIKES